MQSELYYFDTLGLWGIINVVSFLGVLNLDIFRPKCLAGQIYVNCNANSFHSFICKLNIMIVHTLKMCISFLCTFDKYFLILQMLNFDIFSIRNAYVEPGLCNL